MSTQQLASPPTTGSPLKSPHPETQAVKVSIRNLSFYYGKTLAIQGASLDVPLNRVTAFIGPSGCGKSTFLRTLNRMYETIPGARAEGQILLDGADVMAMEVTELRRRIGMVFQKSNPFPKSIYENVAFGLRLNGARGRRLDEAVEQSLVRAALWNEVKDKLHKSAYDLSGGQQQRLSIARTLAVSPEVLLLDEPCSALDPIATAKIEELLYELKKICTIVIVTHNMQQASRTSDFTGFFLMGKLVEFNNTKILFETPTQSETEDYITGRFG